MPRRIDAMALYWHLVDVVWIFLYPLLYLVVRHS
jgi:cytochrome c oxidase subunit 3